MAPPDMAIDAPICTAGVTKPCVTTHPGVCAAGTQTCTSAGWGKCEPAIKVGSQKEVCGSGKDEDCDGKTDGNDTDCQKCAPSTSQSCTTTLPGICAAGSQACALVSGTWSWGACVATIKVGSQKEVCTGGKDEDCDGKVDANDPDCPTCVDKKKNGTETDVDCGGATCPACAAGKKCALAKDCQSGLGCCGGVCTSLTTATNCGACGTACSGVMSCKVGQCACPATMKKSGTAACLEDFNGATPASGWTWIKSKSCPLSGCTSTSTSGVCKGCAKCGSVTACGNIGWSVVTSPKSGGGKAMQVFSYATSGNCWQGDQLVKTYSVGREISTKGLSIKMYVSGAGAGATWQCGSVTFTLLKNGKQVASQAYKDTVYGNSKYCAPTVLSGNKKDLTFDLGSIFGAKDFDALRIGLYKYSCVSGHWHTLTVDDIYMQ